jgi:protein-tyrosine phosphatase
MGRRISPPVALGLVGLLGVACASPALRAGAPGAGGTNGDDARADCSSGGLGGGAVCPRSRPVLACDVMNARDLGGVPLGGAQSVACGVLFRGPPLAGLSASGCADAAVLGLRTLIDLRTDSERAAFPDDACVGAAVVAAPLAIPFNVDTTDYLADFDTDPSIALVFHTLASADAYPVYVHCTFGRDRTGIVAAAVLLVLGASRDDVLAEYALSASTVGAYPQSIEGVLDEIDRRGGIAAALMAKGVSPAELATLRTHAIAR